MPLFILVVAIIVLFCVRNKKKSIQKKKDEYVNFQNEDDAFSTSAKSECNRMDADMKWMEQFNNKYRAAIDKHNENMEMIGAAYTVARELHGFNSQEMNHVISMCKQDLLLFHTMIEAEKEMNNHYNLVQSDSRIMTYTLKRLAIIYERQSDYKKAIEVCEYSISNNCTYDGTEGGFIGRLARLKKKVLIQNNKLPEMEKIEIE